MLSEAVGDLLISGAPVALSPIPIGGSGLLDVRRAKHVPPRSKRAGRPFAGATSVCRALDGPTV